MFGCDAPHMSGVCGAVTAVTNSCTSCAFGLTTRKVTGSASLGLLAGGLRSFMVESEELWRANQSRMGWAAAEALAAKHISLMSGAERGAVQRSGGRCCALCTCGVDVLASSSVPSH